MKKHAIIWILLWAAAAVSAQPKSYTFREAEALCRLDPKPYAIFIKAEWCRYCKMMESGTFREQDVIQKLDSNFYFIVLDAGNTDDITFNGHIFRFNPYGIGNGIHELASELGTIGGQLSYPAFVILSPDYTILSQSGFYVDSSTLLKITEQTFE